MQWFESASPYAGGERAGVGGLVDEELLKRLRTYKRQVAKRYRVVDPEQIERLLGAGPYFISTKLDGELWFLVKRGGEVAFTTFNGRVVRGTSLAKEAEALLANAGDVILAGELVGRVQNQSGRARVHHVATALGDGDLEPTLSFHAFDLVEDEGKDTLLVDYAPRLTRIRALLEGGVRVSAVETVEGEAADVTRVYREWVVSDRFEGVVVRSERGLTYKIKSTLTIDAVVIAYGERITGDVRQVREMSVALQRDDGTWQLLGAVGNGFSEQDRATWHARLSQIEVPSRFRLANREGTLSRFVQPKIVVEIRCSDLLASDSWDAPIRRMSLKYAESGGSPDVGWGPVLETPTAVMIHPIFLRERTDKEVAPEHVGMTQITSHIPLTTAADGGPKVEHRAAEVARRAVFTKTTKDKVAVRKYAIIDTHKGGDKSYPAFVSFFTDYSPGRKDPLQTTLRSAATMAHAEAQVVLWLADNIKRGWGEVEDARVGVPVPLPEAEAPAAKKPAAKKPAAKKPAAKKPAKAKAAKAAGGESPADEAKAAEEA